MKQLRIYHGPTHLPLATTVVIADTYEKKRKGLLDSDFPPVGFGLLFPNVSSIHTEGMAYPIDVIFFDANFKVVGVEDNLPPDVPVVYYPKAQYTLELPPNVVGAIDVKVGDSLIVKEVVE